MRFVSGAVRAAGIVFHLLTWGFFLTLQGFGSIGGGFRLQNVKPEQSCDIKHGSSRG